MTDYNAIANGDVDADSPLNATLLTRLRDNPLALFEGATGAPRLQTAGIADAAVTAAKLAAGAADPGADSVGHDEIDWDNSSWSTASVGAGTYWTFPEGLYMVQFNQKPRLEVYDGSSTWYLGSASSASVDLMCVYSDGANMRIYTHTSGTTFIRYRRIA